MIGAWVTGFATGLSLILAIGAQNAFVLRQGLLRAHVLPLVLLCALSDAVLIAAGVVGFGAAVQAVPALPAIFSALGAAFLAVYGAMRLHAAWKAEDVIRIAGQDRGLWATLAAGAAFTWLNPHVYLDTLALIGAVSTRFHGWGLKTAFGVGAGCASFFFFFSLGYGARLLAPVMQSRRAWQVLDALIGLTMWTIAASLIRSLV